MSFSNSIKPLALAFASLALVANSALAEFNASQYVSDFNSMNGGQGARINYSSTGIAAERMVIQANGTSDFDLSAYSSSTGGSNYFLSFCVEPTQDTQNIYKGSLNYSNGITKTTSNHVVSVGAALLYSQFASGQLPNYFNSSQSDNASYLRMALYHLMKIETGVTSWGTNQYLGYLIDINSDISYWTAAYDPNQYYEEIGNYAVFALNTYTSGNVHRQDFLYVTTADYGNGGGNGGDVPEPATLLLWTLGGLGAAGASWRKRRNQQKARLA